MKNVLLVIIRKFIFYSILIVLVSCNEDASRLYLKFDGKSSNIVLPSNIDINYKGYKIANGSLMANTNIYEVINIEQGVCFSNESKLELLRVSLFEDSFEITIDTIISNEDCVNNKDTFYFDLAPSNQIENKFQNIVDTFLQLVDTLDTHPRNESDSK